MTKIIFCDVDGVLCTNKAWDAVNSGSIILSGAYVDVMDKDCLAAIRKVLDVTNASIVFSTSRRTSMAGLRDAFAGNNALDIYDCHIGKTPDQGYNSHRPNEIMAWLDGVTSKYAVIDDLDMTLYFRDAMFLTHIDTGLTDAIANDIIKYLKD